MFRAFLLFAISAASLPAQRPAAPAPRVYDGTPLLRATLALEKARSRVLEERFTEAPAALRDAEKALRDYERDEPGPHADRSATMRQEIESAIDRGFRDPSDTVDRINVWLGELAAWSKRARAPVNTNFR
jgi:Tfp pilus assembly protein PilX